MVLKLVEQAISGPKFKGLNPIAAVIGENLELRKLTIFYVTKTLYHLWFKSALPDISITLIPNSFWSFVDKWRKRDSPLFYLPQWTKLGALIILQKWLQPDTKSF